MGKNNRQRRAAKQRQRRQDGSGRSGRKAPFQHQWPYGGVPPRGREDAAYAAAMMAEALAAALSAAADCHRAGENDAAIDCVRELTAPGSPFGAAAVEQVTQAMLGQLVEAVVQGGWQPVDLHQVTVRRLGPGHLPVLAVMLRDRTSAYAAATVHPRWQAQLADLGPDAAHPTEAGILDTGRRHGLDPVDALALAVELIGLLHVLPTLTSVIPPPGRFTGSAHGVTEVEARLLARVRALLAKAESTEFSEEAEALTAKAQDLMTRHSLERLVIRHGSGEPDPISADRLWLDAPYASAKSLVVHVVAVANRCRSVWSDGLGFATIVGRDSDLAAVELLTTSLLVQATRAMVDVPPSASARNRTRSFRQSFIVAFATRIGERLRGAADTATHDLSDAADRPLLPVLRAASERVDQAFAERFPDIFHRQVNVSNGAGWAAGTAAADLARLDVHPQVRASADPDLADSA